jgi:sulfur carrier protein
VTIIINGEPRSVANGATVGTLLESLGLHPRLIVVEYNREILDRARYDATEIKAGDSLELVHFVGGG